MYKPQTQESLPSVKLRPNAANASEEEPVVVLSGRDLVGMPHAVAFTAQEAEEVAKKLWNFAAALKVGKEMTGSV